MAIQPIDLQTLFTQLDKVGKGISAQREGLAVQQAIQGTQLQRKTEEHIQEVNEAQDTGDGAEKVHDRGGSLLSRNKKEKKKDAAVSEASVSEEAEGERSFFTDPSMGRNIDISL